jgi:hypothetical protein
MNSESSRFKNSGEGNFIRKSGTQEENLEILQEEGQILTQEYPWGLASRFMPLIPFLSS